MSKKASRRIDSTARTALAGALFLSALHGFEDHFVESVRRDTLHRVDHWMARWRRRLSDTGSLWVLAAGAALGVNVVKAVLRERRQAIESGRRSAVGGHHHHNIRTRVVGRAQALAGRSHGERTFPDMRTTRGATRARRHPALDAAVVSAW